ncbi:MAG TPA: macro domain-containing protein [Myxococcales bacterium]|jgi:O-acetyl-ADP-ribose deacetylase (regulator of RNase III)
MRLEVFRGSLLDVPDVEALVVPANKQLTLGWGTHLAEAIAQRAGPRVEEEALRWAEDHLGAKPGEGIALGEASVSSGGALPCRWLVHAAVLDKYDFNPLFLLKLRQRTSDETLRLATRASLARARELGIRSMAFSLMGAGIGGMPAKKCAAILVAELSKTQAQLERIVVATVKEKEARIVEATCKAAS